MSEHGTQTSEGSDPERSFYRLNADGGIVAVQGQAEGEAAIGAVLKNPDGSLLHEISVRIGWVTDHHVAEYQALIAGLRLARGHGVDRIHVFLDSAVVVNQVNGDWKVKEEHFKPLWMEAHALVREFADIEISHVGRRQNAEAHALADKALAAIR
jgi:ribonuclease HI